MANTMKVWVTRYCLTQGLYTETVIRSEQMPSTVYTEDYAQFFILGRTAFEDESAAVSNANLQRAKKIASLKKQIEKLKVLDFSAMAAADARHERLLAQGGLVPSEVWQGENPGSW